jgi:hypothetical protein
MQDNDPVRRTCFGSGANAAGNLGEDNCSHSGDLGFLLVMNDVPETHDSGTTSDPLRYNATQCTRGKFTSATLPDIYDMVTQVKASGANFRNGPALCPNGDRNLNTGGCVVPADATGTSPQCLASKITAPPTPIFTAPVPLAHPVAPGVAEGREYNQHLYINVGTSGGGYQNNGFTTPMPVTGAFFRIHTNHSMNPASSTTTPITCQFPDMTDQIGCLVNASPCSLGYAGRGATDHNPNTDAVKINKQNPIATCITGDGVNIPGFTYPLSRKLYLDTVPGFASVTTNEQSLVGCETNLAQAVAGTTPALQAASNAGIVSTAIVNAGFIQVPSFYNGGNPYCEDYNENMLCGAATNSASCPTAVPAPYSAFPTSNSTTCGNGIQEAFEDCDCGTAQVAVSAPKANVTACGTTVNGGTVCSTTCRSSTGPIALQAACNGLSNDNVNCPFPPTRDGDPGNCAAGQFCRVTTVGSGNCACGP